jgi:hypothetical protein
MSRIDDGDLPPDLRHVADLLRSQRHEASGSELDQARARILKRAGGQRAARGGDMRKRTVLTSAIMVAAIGTGSAAALAVSGGHVFASLTSSAPAKKAAVRPQADFKPSAASDQYNNPTTTQLTCMRIGVSNSFNCTAKVNGAAGTAPSGTVSFTNSGSGSFAPPTCTLVPINSAMSSCSVVFTATASGVQTLTAVYSGDTTYLPSTSGGVLVAGLR